MLTHQLPAAARSLTIGTTALTLKQAIEAAISAGYTFPHGANSVHISVTGGNNLRYFYDGSTPTASLGHLLAVGGNVVLDGVDLGNILLISTSTSSAVTVTIQTK